MTEELPGFVRRAFLPSPEGRAVAALAWSCDGRWLATAGLGGDVWEMDGFEARHAFTFGAPREDYFQVTWSPTDPGVFVYVEKHRIVCARVGGDGRGAEVRWSIPHESDRSLRPVVSFSPLGDRIVVAAGEAQVDVVAVGDGTRIGSLPAGGYVLGAIYSPAGPEILFLHQGGVTLAKSSLLRIHSQNSIRWAAWSPDGRAYATGTEDAIVRVVSENLSAVSLEGHTAGLLSLEFSTDGRLLFSIALDGTLRLWRTDTWQMVGVVEVGETHEFVGGLAAAPRRPVLARRSITPAGVELYEVDYARLIQLDSAEERPRTYANAKVVLLGDTGVGKSGLATVLAGEPYAPTDSTHARKVRTFGACEVERPDGSVERREILLWDMAGQPAYRLVHQLHLAEVAAALIVFDSRSEIDPFAGVHYWARAMRLRADVPLILVAARTDIGGRPVGRVRVDGVREGLGLAGYFETSAREGKGIAEVSAAIREVIDWSSLPRSVSSDLFESIKAFVLREAASRRMATTTDLFRLFRPRAAGIGEEELRASFETCVRVLELRDLVRCLSFGDFVLLRPELLDSYAAALVIAARDQPDGLGNIAEDDALAGRFPLPAEDRLPAAEERLLLIAVVEELLRHDLVLREPTADGVDLVFPSQLTVDRPDSPEQEAADIIFRFDGAVQSVYATLAVRLGHVPDYERVGMWRDASDYRARVGGVCGLRIRPLQEGRGELTVYFSGSPSEQTRFLFEEYVRQHLEARAVPGSVERDRVFTCPGCAYRVPVDLVRRRQARGNRDMACPDCENVRISLLDREDRLPRADVRQMNASADLTRDRSAATASVLGKEYTRHYDVYLCFDQSNQDVADLLVGQLRQAGLLAHKSHFDAPFLGSWESRMRQRVAQSHAIAILLGPAGIRQGQELELAAAFDHQMRRPHFLVVLVELPGTKTVDLPAFERMERVALSDGFERLRQAITGERPRDEFPLRPEAG
ncbi:TIR domain-containing protein [Actinoplanes sp. NPDC000266]